MSEAVDCPKCDRDFDTEKGMKSHHVQIHGETLNKRECEWCEEEYPYHGGESAGRFCSYDCYGEWRSENVVGKNHPQFTGGWNYESEIWKRARKKALNRTDGCCQYCGIGSHAHKMKTGRQLDVHHIRPMSEFETVEEAHKIGNLVPVCIECHRSVEEGRINHATSW